MAKVSQEYVLKVTAQGLKEVVNEIKGLRSDLGGIDKSATGAAGGFDRVSKSAGTADRNIKGAANATNNSTKAFSKMAQGMTGALVPAYATVAANIFALTAAFGALRRAAQFDTQLRAADELAAQTGSSLKIVAANMKQVTNGAISMKDALTSASLAASAGFDGSTIKELTQVAENASKALGVSMTDALNRVFKGAIKAEPELLDELGIILRLDPAARKYAASIGKTVEELTTFEKQQAVVNEVIAQGTEKFGLLGDIDVDPYTKLAAAFSDVSTELIQLINSPIGAFVNFFADSIGALTAALILFSTKVLRTAIPALNDLGTTLKKEVDENFATLTSSIQQAAIEQDVLGAIEGKFSGSKQVLSRATDAIQQEVEELGKTLSKNSPIYTQKYKEILGSKATKGSLSKVIKTVDADLKKLSQTTGLSAKAMERQKLALNGVKAAAEGYLVVLNKVKKGQLDVSNTTEIQIKKFKNFGKQLTLQTKAVATGLGTGFTAGLEGGLKGVTEQFNKLSKGFGAAGTSGQALTKIMKPLAFATTALGGAVGSALKFITGAIPILGQLYIAWEAIKFIYEKVLNIFRDEGAAKQVEDSFKTLGTTVEETGKISLKFKTQFKDGIFSFKDQTKAATIQRNAISGLNSSLTETAEIVKNYDEHWLEKLTGTNEDNLKDELTKALDVYKALGVENERFAELQSQLKTASSKEEILAITNKVIELNKELIKSKDSVADFSNRLTDSSKALGSALSSIFNTFNKVTEEQKAASEISSILIDMESLSFDSIEVLSEGLKDAGEAGKAIIGIPQAFSNAIDENISQVNALKSSIDKLKTRKLEIESKPADYREKDELNKINAQLEKDEAQLNGLRSQGVGLSIELSNRMIDTRDILTDISSAQVKYNNLLLVAKNRLKDSTLSYSEQIEAMKEVFNLENKSLNTQTELRKRIENNLKDRKKEAEEAVKAAKLLDEKNKAEEDTNNTIMARQALRAAENALNNYDIAAEEDRGKAISNNFNRLLAYQKVLTDIRKGQTLGLQLDFSSALAEEELLKAVEAYAKSANLKTSEVLQEINKNIQSAVSNYELKFTIGDIPSLENLFTEDLKLEENAALFKLQQDILAETGDILDNHADKEQILLNFSEERLQAKLQEYLFQAILNNDLQRELDIREIINKSEENAAKRRQQELDKTKTAQDNMISALKKATETQKLQFQYDKARTLEAKKLYAIKLEELRIGKELTDAQKAAIRDREDFKVKLEFDTEFDDVLDGLRELNSVFEELAERIEVLSDPLDQLQAGFLSGIKVAQTYNKEQAEGFNELGLAATDFYDRLWGKGRTFESFSDIATDALQGVGSALQKAAGENEKVAKAGAIIEGVGAVIKAWNSAPFPANLPAVATTIASVGSLLNSIGAQADLGSAQAKGAAIKEDIASRTNEQGVYDRGYMFGNTLVESVNDLKDINYELFSVEHELVQAVYKLDGTFEALGSSLARSFGANFGGSFDIGAISAQFGRNYTTESESSAFGFSTESTTWELLDAGVVLSLQIQEVGGMLEGALLDGAYFLDELRTKVEGGWFGSDTDVDRYFRTFDFGADEINAFNTALQSSLDVFNKTGAVLEKVLGLDYSSLIAGYSIIFDNEKVSILSKSADDAGDAIAALISSITSEFANDLFPWLERFIEGGEDLGDTLVRVVSELSAVDTTLNKFGTSLLDLSTSTIGLDADEYNREFKKEYKAQKDELKDIISMAETMKELTRSAYHFYPWADALMAMTDMFGTTYGEVYAFFDQVDRAGGGNGIGGNMERERGTIGRYWTTLINSTQEELDNLTLTTFEDWIAESIVAWNSALIAPFEDEAAWQEFADAAYDAIFTPLQTASMRLGELETGSLPTGISGIQDMLAGTQWEDIGEGLSLGMSKGEFSTLFASLQDQGAFAIRVNEATGELDTESGPALLNAILALGIGFEDLRDTEQVIKEIEDWLGEFTDSINNFGKSDLDIKLFELDKDLEKALVEAAEKGIEDVTDIETYFGLQRLEIIREWNEEILDTIQDTRDSIKDAMIDIYSSAGVWDDVAYQSIKVAKAASVLQEGLKDLGTGIDFSVFDNVLDTGDFENFFGNLLDFGLSAPESIEDQIELVGQLQTAVMDRYNAEVQAIENLRNLAIEIGDYLDDLKLGDFSPLTNVERLAEAQSQFTTNLANLNSDDEAVRAKAQQDLTSSADTYLEVAKEYYGISQGFQDIFNSVYSSLSGLQADIIDEVGLSGDTLAINALQQQTLDQLGTLDLVLDVLEASQISDFEQELLDWKNMFKDVIQPVIDVLESLEAAVWGTTLDNLNSFDTGTSEVKFDQVAKIHKGEMILTPETSEEIRRGESIVGNVNNFYNEATEAPINNNSELLAAINILTQVLAESQEDLLDQGERLITTSNTKTTVLPTKTTGIV